MRLFSTLCSITLLSASMASAEPPGFTIKAKITGLADGTKMYLLPGATQEDEKPVDSAIVSKGAFTFKGDVPGPRFFYIRPKDAFGGCSVMVENGNITIQANATTSERQGSKVYDFKDVKVTGSPSHLQYLKKYAIRDSLNVQYDAYHLKAKEVTDALNKAAAAKDTALVASLKKSDAWKQFEKDETAFFNNVTASFKNTILADKDSWWGPFMMLSLYSYFTPKEGEMFEAFSPAAKESHYGKIVHERLYPEGFAGKRAPFIGIKDALGKTYDSTAITGVSKYVLVDFWASWCVPCRKKIPALKKLYSAYHDKGFEIVSISIDKKEPDWHKALKEEQLAWPNYLDLGETSRAWKIRTIPAVFLLDDKGNVVMENMSEEDLEKKLQTL